MQTLSSRDKGLVALMIFVVLVGAVLLLLPSGSGGANLGKQIPLEDAQKQITQAKKQIKLMDDDIGMRQPRIERMTYTLPAEQLSATVTQDLYTLAEKAGVHIREIKPLRAKTLKSGTIARVPLEVRFRAPFQPNVMKFLYMAEDPANKIVVDKVSITSTDSHLKSVDVAAQISVFTRSLTGSSSGGGEGDTSDITPTTNRG